MKAVVAGFIVSLLPLLSYADAGAAVRGFQFYCAADLEKHCRGAKPGADAVQCFRRMQAPLSDACKAALVVAVSGLRPDEEVFAISRPCEDDEKAFCANVPRDGIGRCLIANADRLSSTCGEGLQLLKDSEACKSGGC